MIDGLRVMSAVLTPAPMTNPARTASVAQQPGHGDSPGDLTTQFIGPLKRAKPSGAEPLQMTLGLTPSCLQHGRAPEAHRERHQTSSTPEQVACIPVAAHTPSVRPGAFCADSEGSLERSCLR
jgi:hypothetical protein